MSAPLGPLAGRHALVTGAGRGIGAAIATALAGAGARVTLLGRDRARLEATAQRLAAGWVAADVTVPAEVASALDEARRQAGEVAILVNNAGAALSAPFARTSADDLARMLAVNLAAAFSLTQALLPGMLAGGFGRIVNVASTAGLKGYAYCSAYCAAKHGLIGLTRALALELATKPVTVNAVCPGFTDTDLTAETLANIRRQTGRSEAEARAALTAYNPQRRLIAPAEVAGAVLWLAAPGSASINGQAIAVAGGEVT